MRGGQKFLLGTTNRKKFVTNKNPNLMVMSKTVRLEITCRFTRRWSGKYNFFQGSQVRYFDFDQNRVWGLGAYGALLDAYLYCCTM